MSEKYIKQLDLCPDCGSGDLRWCNISVRPYCMDCGRWGRVNHGTPKDAIKDWNYFSKRGENL